MVYKILKNYIRESDRMHVIRIQLPIEECPKSKQKQECGWRNNGCCLNNRKFKIC